VILANATSGSVTISLPSAAGIAGKQYSIKKIDGSANAVVVDPNGAETVDGAPTYSLAAQNDFVTVISDGTNWWIISR
jgi:hypothetical protein